MTEFSTLLADELAASVGDQHGYDVQEVRIELVGLCNQCREAQDAGETAPQSSSRDASGVVDRQARQDGTSGQAAPLTTLQPGEAGVVAGFTGGSSLGGRLAGLGFAPGARIKVLQARSHGPLIVLLRDTRVALGAGEASQVLVVRTESGHE